MDQRGFPRSNPCDIGAFEVQPTATPTPTPTRTPTPTPTSKPTPTPTPTAIATPIASVTSTSVSNVAVPGATVSAGTFTVRNDSALPESISSVSINLSHPGLFSAMTLSGGGQSDTLTAPGTNATFTFATPITVPPRGSVTLSLSAVIAANPAMLGDGLKYAGLTPHDPLPISTNTWPLADGFLLLGIALMGLPDNTRRRTITIAMLALCLAAGSAGCGSSAGPRVLGASSQQVTAVAITASGVPATVEGLPAKLGTIAVL